MLPVGTPLPQTQREQRKSIVTARQSPAAAACLVLLTILMFGKPHSAAAQPPSPSGISGAAINGFSQVPPLAQQQQ